MKCAYCGNEIPAGEEVSGDGSFFCNTIHRYSWKQSGTLEKAASVPSGTPAAATKASATPFTNGLMRKIIGSAVYSAATYFFLMLILSMLMGAVAGVEAGQNGQDAAEAGRNAGENFGRTYGLFIMVLCIILSTVGSFKGFLPLTTSSKQ
ncbi:MAG: hypothetical protein ACOYNS_09230 [Bacteroidota bacterium]